LVRISHIDITTATDGDTSGAIELTVPRTGATESGLEDSIGVKHLYAVVDRISYIDITTATDGDTSGEIELTVPRTGATESEGKTGRSGTGGDTGTTDRSGRD
jgi:hypothetical protein